MSYFFPTNSSPAQGQSDKSEAALQTTGRNIYAAIFEFTEVHLLYNRLYFCSTILPPRILLLTAILHLYHSMTLETLLNEEFVSERV